MAEDDEGWGQDGAVMESHDQLISLEFPHLVGNGLDFEEGVAVAQERNCNLAAWIYFSGAMTEMILIR